MKQVYLIQDMQQPTMIIAFDGRRSLASYLHKFRFDKVSITEHNDLVTITGTLYDIEEIDGKHARKVFVHVIKTANYGNREIEEIEFFNELIKPM